jgi:hypothetical protein
MSDMVVLDCYRVIRIQATPDQWRQAMRGMGCEVQNFIRRRLDEYEREKRKGDPAERLTITFGESPYRHSLGRSIEYYVNSLRDNGLDIKWQHNGRPYVVSPPQDGRRA